MEDNLVSKKICRLYKLLLTLVVKARGDNGRNIK